MLKVLKLPLLMKDLENKSTLMFLIFAWLTDRGKGKSNFKAIKV